MYASLCAAVVLLLMSSIDEPAWLGWLAGALAAVAGVVFVVVWAARRQDPNGPPGQH